MRRLLVLVPLFALFAILAWFLFLEDVVDSRDGGVGSADVDEAALEIRAPELRGVEGARPQRGRRPRVARGGGDGPWDQPLDGAPGSLNGRVVAKGGAPLSRLLVWQAPKSTMDPQEAASVPWANTVGNGGLDGRFTLPVTRRPDTWIGVRVPGRRTIFLDGATLDWDAWLRIELPDAFELQVCVLDLEGQPRAEEVLRAVPRTRRGRAVAFGGPDAPLQTQIAVTDESGCARFRMERDVTVDVTVVDVLTQPPSLALSTAHPEGILREAKPAKLFLDVLDDATGKHLEEPLTLVFLDASGSGLDFELRTDDSPDEIETELPFPPGQYMILVRPRDRPDVLIPDLVFARYGVELRRTVRVPAEQGSATLQVEALGASLKGAYWQLGRLDGGWRALGWTASDLSLRSTRLHVMPGVWSAVLVLPASGNVCVLPTQTLEEAQTVVLRGAPRPGVIFALYTVLPADIQVCAIHVEVAGLGRFQACGRTASGTTLRREGEIVRAIHAAGSRSRRTGAAGPVLGPYPDGVTVVVRDEQGQEHRLPVR